MPVTATAAPCTSLFKPVRVAEPLALGQPTDKADDSLWWRHERFHRLIAQNPTAYRDLYVPERNALEADWSENPPEPKDAFAKHDELLDKWFAAAQKIPASDVRPGYVKKYWSVRATRAGLR